MADAKDYLHVYKKFFEDFAASIEPYDQLPVKVAGYYIRESEVTGEVVDWTLQYLSQKKCPPSLVTPLIKIVVDEVKVACAKNPADCGFVAHENVYQPLRLMHAVMAKANEVCLRYKDNGRLHSLPEPASKSHISCCAIKNSRRRMEDRHVVIEDFHGLFGVEGCGPASYFAVFDGHAGVDAASYSVSHLHQFLAESHFYPSDPERALRDAFLRTDALFLEKSNRENLHSGTTAVCALLGPGKALHVAWLGDSQALLVRRGRSVGLVNPHKPDREDERQRIEGMGGSVLFWGTWRVNGQLAVSRAIGDLEYKPYVTAEPDVVSVPLDGTEDFLILGCDGLWDFVSEEAIVRAIYEQLKNSPGDLEAVTESLVQLSKEQGSTDNISVIVVFLTDPAALLDDRRLNAAARAAMDAQKTGLLLDLEGCARGQNGPERLFPSPGTNGKREHEDHAGGYDDYDDDDDLGPETDVDAVDDVLLSPAIAAAKKLLVEKRGGGVGDEGEAAPRGDTPTPPADRVANVSREAAEVDNAGESGEDSEDEWNYFAVEPKKKPTSETISLSQEKTTDCDISEVERQKILDMESRLNPNAAEFVPSPTHAVPLLEECLLACSPRKDEKREIAAVPTEQEFDKEARKCPGQEIELLENHVDLLEGAVVKPRFGDDVSSNLSDLKPVDLQTPDFYSNSVQTKNPFGDELISGVNEKESPVQSDVSKAFRFDSENELLKNSEPVSFELKKEICPEMEPEPERVCLDTMVDDIAQNGLSPTTSPDVSETSHGDEKIEYEPFIAICPPKPEDLTGGLDYIPEQMLESYVAQINAEIKESAEAVLSSCTTLPDTTGLDETGGSLSPLETDAVETKPDSTSDKHLFECDPDIVPVLVDSTTLSESATDSSPVNDLETSSPLNKLIEDPSPLSEHSESYKLLQEPSDVGHLEKTESQHPMQEHNDSMTASHKFFGDDAPFHGFTESEILQEHMDNVSLLQKNAENKILSNNFGNVGRLQDQSEVEIVFHGRVEGGIQSHDRIEDSLLSHDRIEDSVLSHDRIEDSVLSHDRIEDSLLSHDRIEDSLLSHDRIEDSLLSHGHIEDSLLSHGHIEDALQAHGRIEDALQSHDRIEDALQSHDRIEDALQSHDRIEDALQSHDRIEDALQSHDRIEDALQSHDRIEDALQSHDRIEDAPQSHDRIEDAFHQQNLTELISSTQGKLDDLADFDFDKALRCEVNDTLDIVSSTSPFDQDFLQKTKSEALTNPSLVESSATDFHIKDVSSSPFDLSVKQSELSVDSTVTNKPEPEVLGASTKVQDSASAPELILGESESSKFAAESLEKELKDDKDVNSVHVSKGEFEPSSQTSVVVEPETTVLPKFETEVTTETVENLIASPNKESDEISLIPEPRVDESADKTSVSDVASAAAVVTAAAVTAGAVLATKTDTKGPTPVKAPATSKTKKTLTDKTKSPVTQKSLTSQKTVAASPRVASNTAASKSPLKPSLSPTKTTTAVKKTATPTRPKSAVATVTVTSSNLTSTTTLSPSKTRPLSARPSPGSVKSSPPLKPSAPIPKARPLSAVTKASAAEKKPAPMTNGIAAKVPVKEHVIIKRTTASAKTLRPAPSTATAPRQSISRSTTAKTTTSSTTTTTTSTGMVAKPKTSATSVAGVTKPPARAPVSTVTQKQVKETANKQISSARPSSTISAGRTSSTTTTSRRMTAGGTRTTTTTMTTTSPKSNLGSKVTTKKTTITSRTTAPAKSKSQPIENNEEITTTMISTEMKVDPIETTKSTLLE
ncbi:uncharacterized protein LOC134540210 [Bacillus rossius redtenbacheri]|uniref:uncharacterized protein LOC134540210 n=1 Tax=Bacillus rossius redtenbacheri TaxID=93214 RepID=UPI002FDD6AD9